VRRPPRILLLVGLLVAVLGFYFVLLGVRAVSLLGDPRWAVKGLGLGILLLPVVGLVIVVQEVSFGRASQRLGERLEREVDAEEPTGAGTGTFDKRREQVQAAPEDWRAWYRLGEAYGEAGDVGRGRRAVRRAIMLEKRSTDANGS
jgi:cytochrome c-type biogenesis protein CcmH/NrfG